MGKYRGLPGLLVEKKKPELSRILFSGSWKPAQPKAKADKKAQPTAKKAVASTKKTAGPKGEKTERQSIGKHTTFSLTDASPESAAKLQELVDQQGRPKGPSYRLVQCVCGHSHKMPPDYEGDKLTDCPKKKGK